MTVTIGSDAYSLVGVAVDTTNVSTAPNGISGALTFSGSVTVADGTAGNTVTALERLDNRASVAAREYFSVTASDTLSMSNLLDAVAKLRLNAVPEIDGAYNCYLDPVSSRQLFADPDFKQLFQGATSANQVFKKGMTNDFLGLRFVPTTEAFVQPHPTLAGLMIRRPVICGQGALDRRRLRRDGCDRCGAGQFHHHDGRWYCDGDPRSDRPPAADHCAVLVLDRGVLRAVGHHHQSDDGSDRDQRRVQARGYRGTYRLTTTEEHLIMPLGSVSPFRPTGTVSVSQVASPRIRRYRVAVIRWLSRI